MDNIKIDSNAVIIHDQIITKTQLINDVQRWVLAETQLKQLNEKVKQMRELKAISATNITAYTRQQKYTGNIKISDGELRICEKKEYTPLTFTYLEKCLGNIIPDNAHVEYIIKYLKDNREITTSQDIKRIFNKL
jgi:hypothetical protein